MVAVQRDAGIYAFTKAEKNRVLDLSPWSLANYLLVLKPWVAKMPPHCLDFSACAFWVQLHGLPPVGYTEETIRRALQFCGKVLEVRVETKGNSSLRTGKVMIEVRVEEPLQSGTPVFIGERKYWADFRGER